MVPPDETVPTLPAGITWLIDDGERSAAPHQLVLAQVEANPGEVLWIDARDVASTYTLYRAATSQGMLDSFRIARAWTAHQHHTLAHRAVEHVSSRTRVIALPHVCSLYRDDDIDDREADHLLRATLRILAELAEVRTVPVLLTAPPTERSMLEDVAEHEVRYETTEHGHAFVGESYRTTVYHGRGWWQTTIPYWVELVGELRTGEQSPWALTAAYEGIEAYG